MLEIVAFEKLEPIRFTKQSTGEEYIVSFSGKVNVNEYDPVRCPSKEELTIYIRSNIKPIMESMIELLPENGVINRTGARMLGSYFLEAFENIGVQAYFEVTSFNLTKEYAQNNMKNKVLSGDGMPETIPEPSFADLIPETHGPVTSVITSYSRLGMMMGDFTSEKEYILWQEDGGVIIKKCIQDHGKETDIEIKGGSEAAAKLRSYITESRIAEMAQVKPIQSPYMLTDVSISSEMTIVFNDSSIGGSERVKRTLDCRSKWKVLSEAVSEIKKLIGECENSGTVISKTEST